MPILFSIKSVVSLFIVLFFIDTNNFYTYYASIRLYRNLGLGFWQPNLNLRRRATKSQSGRASLKLLCTDRSLGVARCNDLSERFV